MGPNEKAIEVRDLDGNRKPARMLCCTQCNSHSWICFIVEGFTHSHFQCCYCMTTFCPDGKCGVETTVDMTPADRPILIATKHPG